jgi:hypothetical protein
VLLEKKESKSFDSGVRCSEFFVCVWAEKFDFFLRCDERKEFSAETETEFYLCSQSSRSWCCSVGIVIPVSYCVFFTESIGVHDVMMGNGAHSPVGTECGAGRRLEGPNFPDDQPETVG